MSFNDLLAMGQEIERAKNPEDIFGVELGPDISPEARCKVLKKFYHKYLSYVHPDKFTDPKEVGYASAILLRLNELYQEGIQLVEAGTYNKPRRKKKTTVPVSTDPIVVTVKSRKYIIQQPAFHKGDLADLYRCVFDDGGKEQSCVLKLARSASDNDLLESESKTLGKLYPAKQEDIKYYRYLPRLVDSFSFRSPGGSARRANVFPYFDGFYSVEEVLQVYPKGLDFRDVVWMFKRVLEGMGFYHRQGFIHGAIIPPHVLVHPTGHGARIIDWCYAVPANMDRVRAISKKYKGLYAPEILEKFVPTTATDIYMAVKVAILLLGGKEDGSMPSQVPSSIRGFLSSCLAKAPTKRPDDAWKLHEELVELLERVVGKPQYRPLAMPPSAKA